MPTPRKYATHAARQAAYRARLRTRQEEDVTDATARRLPAAPGARRWTALLTQARGLLETVTDEMAAYATARTDAWQESERGEAFQERCERLDEVLSLLHDLAEASRDASPGR